MPFIIIGGLIAGGWAAKQVGNAFEDAAQPVKWIVAAT